MIEKKNVNKFRKRNMAKNKKRRKRLTMINVGKKNGKLKMSNTQTSSEMGRTGIKALFQRSS